MDVVLEAVFTVYLVLLSTSNAGFLCMVRSSTVRYSQPFISDVSYPSIMLASTLFIALGFVYYVNCCINSNNLSSICQNLQQKLGWIIKQNVGNWCGLITEYKRSQYVWRMGLILLEESSVFFNIKCWILWSEGNFAGVFSVHICGGIVVWVGIEISFFISTIYSPHNARPYPARSVPRKTCFFVSFVFYWNPEAWPVDGVCFILARVSSSASAFKKLILIWYLIK